MAAISSEQREGALAARLRCRKGPPHPSPAPVQRLDRFQADRGPVAAEYSKGPSSKPVFGVIGLRGKTAYNDEDDKVVISDIVVTELNFSSLGRDELDALAIGVGKLLPTGPLTIPEARITASLANQKRMAEAKGLRLIRRRSCCRKRRRYSCRPTVHRSTRQ